MTMIYALNLKTRVDFGQIDKNNLNLLLYANRQ